MKELSRRRLLQGLLALGVAPLVGCGVGGSPMQNLLRGLLQEIALPDPLRVGLAHLRDLPADRDPTRLLEAVFADLPLAENFSELRHAFARRLREEIANQQTINTDGWLLSLSESRFCALLAMCFFGAQDPRSASYEQDFVATDLDRC